MALLSRREHTVFAAGTVPVWATQYRVTAYEAGAETSIASSSTTVTVRAGHGFAADDYFIDINASAPEGTFRKVTATTATTLTIASAVALSAGATLVNLGPDTGATSPNYDGSPLSIYADMAQGTAYTNATVTADAYGGYSYWTQKRRVWELIRTLSGTPTAVNKDIFETERLCVNGSSANTNTLGSVTTYSFPVYDENGTLLGYAPIFGSEW